MAKNYKEWFLQSEYDYQTAQTMFDNGRYFYTVFMCHLSIEKALKGFYVKETDKLPPKIHKLSYFVDKLKLSPTKEMQDFFESMDDASVATRYPDSLKEISNKYKKTNTKTILAKTKTVLKWINEEQIK